MEILGKMLISTFQWGCYYNVFPTKSPMSFYYILSYNTNVKTVKSSSGFLNQMFLILFFWQFVFYRRSWWSEPCGRWTLLAWNMVLSSQAMLWTKHGTDTTEVNLLWWTYSLKTSEVCFSQLPFAGFKEGTLYLTSMLWTELSLCF